MRDPDLLGPWAPKTRHTACSHEDAVLWNDCRCTQSKIRQRPVRVLQNLCVQKETGDSGPRTQICRVILVRVGAILLSTWFPVTPRDHVTRERRWAPAGRAAAAAAGGPASPRAGPGRAAVRLGREPSGHSGGMRRVAAAAQQRADPGDEPSDRRPIQGTPCQLVYETSNCSLNALTAIEMASSQFPL